MTSEMQMAKNYQLAQVNIAKAKAPLDDPVMKGFVDQLDHINRLAENSPGFVWRLKTDEGDATAIQMFEDPLIIVNMSVWESLEALRNYVYSGDHLIALKSRKNWFEKLDMPALALWWVPTGRMPAIESAKIALEKIRAHGASPEAFTFAKSFPAPETNREANQHFA